MVPLCTVSAWGHLDGQMTHHWRLQPRPDRRRLTTLTVRVGRSSGAISVAAALAVELLGVSDVAPMHYGTFPLLAGTPDQLRGALADRGLSHVAVHETTPGNALA